MILRAWGPNDLENLVKPRSVIRVRDESLNGKEPTLREAKPEGLHIVKISAHGVFWGEEPKDRKAK